MTLKMSFKQPYRKNYYKNINLGDLNIQSLALQMHQISFLVMNNVMKYMPNQIFKPQN